MSRVLVVEDDPRIRKTLEVNLRATRLRRGPRRNRRGRAAARGAASPRRRHPRPRPPGDGRPRRGARSSRVGHRCRSWSCPGVTGGRQGRSARPRCRRLPHEAVRHGRALRQTAGRDAPSGAPGGQGRASTTPDFTIDFSAKQASRGDEIVRLTPTQWHIIEVLVRNAGPARHLRATAARGLGPDVRKETNYLRVFMTQIRQKLEPDPPRPRYFITEPGLGFRFEGPPGES